MDPPLASRTSARLTADDASITAGLHQSKVYALGGNNAARDAANGLPLRPFSSATPGAFDGDIGVFLVGHTLQAIDLRDNHILWATTADGGRSSPSGRGSCVALG